MKLKKRQKREAIRFAEYLVGGGVWFWSGYLIIIGLDGWWTPFDDKNLDLLTINFIGNAVGITLNFLIARYWVFKTNKPAKLETTTRRYIIYTALNAFLLNFMILRGLKEVGIQPEIGQFIASGFFTIWNYYWYKVWVFKGREKPRHVRHHTP